MLSPSHSWTEDRLNMLSRLWADGLSASQIAAELGDGVTRNAVIGQVYRLGLHRGKLIRIARPKPESGARTHKPRAIPTPTLVCEEIPAEVPTVEPPLHIDLLDLKPHHCRYPYGNGPFTFCGHQVAPDKPYCAAHWAACNTGRP